MGQNVGELVTGSPVSWWTCVKATGDSPNAFILVSFLLVVSVLLLISLIKACTPRRSPAILPSGSSDTSFPFLRSYRRACATDCNGISRIHACSPVVSHVRAPARCVWAWISPRRKRYVGPRRYLLLIHFDDSRVKGACTPFHRNFEGSSNKDLKDAPLVSLKFLTVRFVYLVQCWLIRFIVPKLATNLHFYKL